jgi:hypothetical protein
MLMRIVVLILIGPLAVLFPSGALAQQNAPELIYRFDPALTVEGSRPSALSAESPVVIDKDGNKANVHLQTEGPFTPYVGAERTPELSDREAQLLADKRAKGELPDYHLEAGIGLLVEDKASLSLGYRFSNPPSLLDERRNDPLSLDGDVRINFGFKVPLD